MDSTRRQRRLLILLATVSDVLRRDIDDISHEFAAGGNWGDLQLLGRIYYELGGEARPSQLLGYSYSTSAGVTGGLRRLENVGLIERKRTEDDRRVLLACITDRGSTQIEAAVPPYSMIVDKRLGDLSEEEVDWLYEFVDRQINL